MANQRWYAQHSAKLKDIARQQEAIGIGPSSTVVDTCTPPSGFLGLRPQISSVSGLFSSPYLPRLPQSGSSITFRHPGYQDEGNILFCLPRFDGGRHPGIWGIHHGTALAMCSIIACNISGVLSPIRWDVSSHPPTPIPDLEGLLTASTYYFYPLHVDEVGLAYPVCRDFDSWQFPHHQLPLGWTEIIAAGETGDTCRISNSTHCPPTTNLIPQENSKWFTINEMKTYNLDKILLARYPTSDIGNGIRLRKDLHLLFDSRAFVIIPKASTWRVHFLNVTTDYGRLLHNRKTLTITLPREFMFARFAWAVIPFAKEFATRPGVKVRAHDALLGQWVDWVVPSDDIPAAVVSCTAKQCRWTPADGGVAKRSQLDSARWARGVLDAGTAVEARRESKSSARRIIAGMRERRQVRIVGQWNRHIG